MFPATKTHSYSNKDRFLKNKDTLVYRTNTDMNTATYTVAKTYIYSNRQVSSNKDRFTVTKTGF